MNTYEATIRMPSTGSGDQYRKVSIQADSPYAAKTLIEGTYGAGTVQQGPNQR